MAFVADEFTGRRFGKFEVLCRLAVGGMAEIFLGFPLAGPFALRPVVLKRILADHREDPSSLQMLIDEAKLTAQLSHRHIAQVLDLEVAGEDVVLVIELIQGANLEELVQAASERGELLPLGLVVSLVRDAALGLQHAHSHKDLKGAPMPIIHRDVTPRNVMITFDGVGKVLDFGIARAVGAARRTVAGMVRGTAAYMSPEQAIDAKVDTRSDIFSLGTLFHEMLTGQRLFARGNPGKEMAAVYEAEIPAPSAVNRRVPKAFDSVVLRALERSVSRRYQTPAELVRDLTAAAGTTAWAADRCGAFVAERFRERQRELSVLLKRIPDDGPAATTDVGRERLSEEEMAGLRTEVGAQVPTETVPAVPEKAVRPRAGALPQRRQPSARGGRDANGGDPTRFHSPSFDDTAEERDAERDTDDGPVPTAVREGTQSRATVPEIPSPNADRRPRAPPTDTAGRPELNTATQRAGSGGLRTALLALGAVLAMVLGAAGGVLVYRTMAAPKSLAVGRLSVATDRPAEVRVNDTVMRAPFADLYLSAGPRVIEVRPLGTEGEWKKVDCTVEPDRVTKLEIKLDGP